MNALVLPLEANSKVIGIIGEESSNKRVLPEGKSLIHLFTFEEHADMLNKLPDEKVTAIIKEEIAKFVPSATNISPIFVNIVRWNEAMCFPPVGMYTAVTKLKEENGKQIEGFYLAGDYLNLSSVEGSAKSGMTAAKKLYADFNG